MILSSRLRSLTPAPIKRAVRELSYLTIFSDLVSLIRFLRVNHPRLHHGPVEVTADLRIRRLHDNPITIRTRGTDARVVFDTFMHQFHLPPDGAVSKEASLMLDLGSNIGCTMAHLACVYPKASIVGVELDGDNARICRRNISAWSDRCRVMEGAVWPEDGHVHYEYESGREDGFVAVSGAACSTKESRTAPALSINTLLDVAFGDPTSQIDYMKMDIEGAERDVLRLNTTWASRVRCIKVELHDGYSEQACIADLEALGFDAWADRNHASCVIGLRHATTSRRGCA